MSFKTLIPVLSLAFMCACGLDPVNSKPEPSLPDTKGQSSTQAEPKNTDQSTTQEDSSTQEEDSSTQEPDATKSDPKTEDQNSSESSKPEDKTSDSSSTESGSDEEAKLSLQADKSAVWFIGAKEKFERVGTFREIVGEAQVKDGVLTGLEVKIDTASVNTPFVRLTAHMLNQDFFDVKKFPSASFRSTKIRKLPVEDSDEALPNYEIVGELQILAVTKEIDFVATVDLEKESVVHRASFEINRKDFGMNYDGKPEDPIFDEVKLEIDLSFSSQAP